MSYRLRTLGSIRILDDDGSEVELRSAKHTALFLYLNAIPRRKHLRSELCEMFWTTERSRARHSLSQALYDIRNRIGPVVATPGSEGVRLDAPGARYDVDELEERMAEGDTGSAVELYRGPYAMEMDQVGTDAFEHWLEGERRRIRILGHNAFRKHILSLEERGDWKGLADVARRFIKRAPEDVEAQRTFIRSLWLGGDRASALEYFTSLRERDPRQAEQLRPLVDRIEGRSPDRVRETADPEDPPLIGREDEMRRLRRLSRSLDGLEVVHLQGEAGVGKTRLVQELADALDLSGFHLIQSRCWEAESDVPYSTVAEGLEPWLGPAGASGCEDLRLARAALFPTDEEPGDLADREALKELRRRVFEEVTTFVRNLTSTSPTLWIVEDVQWVDRTSAALLHYMVRRLSDDPLLLVFTSRPSLDRVDGLSRHLGQPAGVVHLNLGPLDEAAVRELVTAASSEELPTDVGDRIAELSGGNPYFALELLRAFRERPDARPARNGEGLDRDLVDDRLERVLRERLRSVSVEGLKVLEAVAVLAGRAPWSLVLSLARVDVGDPSWICDQLTRQKLLTTDETKVEFAHDILRELIYADMGEIRRCSLHQMAAESLAREGDVSPGVLANHFHRGGDPDRAYHYALAAARDAEGRGAHQEAASYADVALSAASAADGAPNGSGVQLRRLAARAYSCAGELEEAASRLEPLTESDPEELSEDAIRGLLELAEIRIDQAQVDEARASLRAAAEGIDRSVSGPKAAGLNAERLSLELRVEIHDGDRESIDAAGERLKVTLKQRALIEDGDRARASVSLAAYLAFFENAREARTLLEEVLTEDPPTRSRLRMQALLGTINLRSCRWERAEYLFEQGRLDATNRNDVAVTAKFLNNLGCLQMERGRWMKAERKLKDAQSYYRSSNAGSQWAIDPVLNSGNASLYQMKVSHACEQFSRVIDMARRMKNKKYEAEARTCLGLLDLQAGDRRAAERQYRKVRKLIDVRSLSQEGFKVTWFSAFCDGDGSPAAVLLDRAASYRDTDRLSYLKLLWLAEISDGKTEPAEEVRLQLRDHGLLWFEKFAERWMRVTRGNEAAG